MYQGAFDDENFDLKTYINNTFANSSETDINNALSLLQKTISLSKLQNKTLVKKHFSKFVECNTVLEKIVKDLKNRSIPSSYIKNQCNNIASKIQRIENFPDEQNREEEKSFRSQLQSNYNSFTEFVNIYKQIKDKSIYQNEKVTFLNFLMEKIENQKYFLTDVTRYFELYFEVEDDGSKDEKFYNTLLVCFKYHMSSISLVNSDFNLFFNRLSRIVLNFFRFINPEQIKEVALKDVFKNILEHLEEYKNNLSTPKKKKNVCKCNCLTIRSARCNQETKKSVANRGSRRQLITAKIFMRKISELRNSLSRFLPPFMNNFVLGQIERSKEIWISTIFMNLDAVEDHFFYKEISEMFGSRKEHLVRNTVEYLLYILDSIEVCDVRKYEAIEIAKQNLQKEMYNDVHASIFEGIYLVLGRTKTIEILKEIQQRLLKSIAGCLFNICKDDNLCLIMATRIMQRGPNSWKRILRYSGNAFQEKKVACFFLQEVFDNGSMSLSSTEKSRVKQLLPIYGFFLENCNSMEDSRLY